MPQLRIQQALDLAVQHHRAGRLQEAEGIYRQILAREPNHTDALHFLGLIAHQLGRNETAVDLISRSLALNPNVPEAHCNLGCALHDMGRREEAVAAYLQAIALKPDYPEAHYNLGIALKNKGDIDAAVAAYRQAIALKPDHAAAYFNLGIALTDSGKIDQAIAAYGQAIALRPNYVEAISNLGNIFYSQGRSNEAVAAHRQAVALRPDRAAPLNNLANALQGIGQLDEAVAAYRRAIALEPDFPEPYSNLGNLLREMGKLDESIAVCRRAIALRPDYPEAHFNFSNALMEKGQLHESIAAGRQAMALRPDFPEAHRNLSLALLLEGDFRQGWEEYEWRSKCKDFRSRPWNFPQPQWDGSDLANRTILIHMEQGLGDAIQFARYVPLVAERGGKVIFACYPQLRRLLQGISGITTWLAPGEAIPPFDVHCPLLSLPRAFGTTLESIPAKVPYLSSEPTLSQSWQTRLAAVPSALKVGLVWAGNPSHKTDRNRSMKLADLAPVMRVSGVRFFSLQKGEAAMQAKTPPEGMELVDWTGELNDFADTAALIDNLDLVISVDTAVAHLAGAMGKPIWLMLPFAPDWRWMEAREGKAEGGRRKVEGEDFDLSSPAPSLFRLPPSGFRLSSSPWYPTARLFRQPAAGDWERVIAEVADAFASLVC
jgi:tetratricopeptide (TPR) repeat protein